MGAAILRVTSEPVSPPWGESTIFVPCEDSNDWFALIINRFFGN
jgi:hypothetical protein